MTTYAECPSCHVRVIWARTAAGRKQMLDWARAEDGTIAAHQDALGVWRARTVNALDQLQPAEHRYQSHYVSSPQCRPPSPESKQAADAVVTQLAKWRAARSANAAAPRNRRGHRQPPQTYLGFRRNP